MKHLFLILLALLLLPCATLASTPGILNYQGRVAVDGANFTGAGQFKFALVNGSGTTLWRNDGVAAAGEPNTFVTVNVTGGLYSVLLGDISIQNMGVIPGTVFHANTAGGNLNLRVWFRHNASAAFQQLTPDTRIAAVGYAMMARAVDNGAINNQSIAFGAVTGDKLAAGAVSGEKLGSGAASANLAAEGLSALPTDQAFFTSTLSADPGLISRGYIRTGSPIPLRTEAWTNKVVPGAQEDPGVPVGTADFGCVINGSATNGHYVGVSHFGITSRYYPATNLWDRRSPAPASWGGARYGVSYVWTGTELLFWGGTDSWQNSSRTYVRSSGLRYNPTTDVWTSMRDDSTTPAGRFGAMTVWTGSEMLVWGGFNQGGTPLNTGARYNPTTNTWAPMAATGAPAAAGMGAAVWSGSEMILWGGCTALTQPTFTIASTSSRYHPASNTWTSVTTTGAPPFVGVPGAVWAGDRMIVWGGLAANGFSVNTGAQYLPASNTWQPMTGTPPPSRYEHAMVNVSTTYIIGGRATGQPFAGRRFSSGAWGADLPATSAVLDRVLAYPFPGRSEILVTGTAITRFNYSTNTWTDTSTTIAPDPGFVGQSRQGQMLAWTGDRMLMWGGLLNGQPSNTGKLHNPKTGAWTNTSTTDAPHPRRDYGAVWSGTELLVWGGTLENGNLLADGARYNPVSNTWTQIAPAPGDTSPSGIPFSAGRSGHAVAWTGNGMIVWGGSDGYDNQGSTYPGIGAIYYPASNSWGTFDSAADGFDGRYKPQAIARGRKVYFCGGYTAPNGGPLASTVLVYDLEDQYWEELPNAPVSLQRRDFSFTLAGDKLVVWGGRDAAGTALRDGAIYHTATNTWTAVPTTGLTARHGHTATWTGRDLVIWGGQDTGGFTPFANARLELESKLWSTIPGAPDPAINLGHAAVWNGNQVLYYGNAGPGTTDAAAYYTPPVTGYYYMRP